VPEQLRRLDLYDQPRLQEGFVEVDGAPPQDRLADPGGHHLRGLRVAQRAARALAAPGSSSSTSITAPTAHASAGTTAGSGLSDILKAIAAIGYVAHRYDPAGRTRLYRKERQRALRRLAWRGCARCR